MTRYDPNALEVFIAHGMDQMFGTGAMLLGGNQSSAECPIFPEWHGAVADAVIRTPEGRGLYLQRLTLPVRRSQPGRVARK